MDTSKLKNAVQKLGILKDYSSLVVPVAIALVALLVFIPTQFMSGKLREKIEQQSIRNRGKKVQQLQKKAVPKTQWLEEEKYQQAYGKDVDEIALLAIQSTQRQLLSYKLFPEPKETSRLIFEEFGQQFRAVVDGLIVRLGALDCPTEAELNLQKSGSARQGLNETDEIIRDVLCREKATTASVYANPAELSGYEFWSRYEYSGIEKDVEICWYWQLANWIIEDVVDTIDVLNSVSPDVFRSPVKRLLGVDFSVSGSKDDKPSYVLETEGRLTRERAHTARVCDEDIDVVHFNVGVVVSARAIPLFMQQLCSLKHHRFSGWSGKEPQQNFTHNQITILESRISPVDRQDRIHQLYRYGEDAVVELDLICEYIFNQNSYAEIKPASVKESQELVDKQPGQKPPGSRPKKP